MENYSKMPLAPDSAAGNYSAAAKAGGFAGGVILVLILLIIYEFIRRGGICTMNCKANGDEAPRRGAEEA
ncbi:hypothetical protein IMY05_015G0017100 [Salix suchowensis]|nr:hypothetical protein IMY05_015G0017100 [Salix suchowensis]